LDAEFDYQWKNLPSPDIEYNENRVNEFLKFTKLDPLDSVTAKYCLDAGCGNGRYTYAMQKLGAVRVDSFDLSSQAVERCRTVNPCATVLNLMDADKSLYPVYDFILCWGVLNHIENPRDGFRKLAGLVKKSGGFLHVMVYHKDTQKAYQTDRQRWSHMTMEEKLGLCEEKVKTIGGTVHGWFDALNPKYNHSFTVPEVIKWFEQEGFTRIKVASKYNININGWKRQL
jgi:SAM-dependent methyltransferase